MKSHFRALEIHYRELIKNSYTKMVLVSSTALREDDIFSHPVQGGGVVPCMVRSNASWVVVTCSPLPTIKKMFKLNFAGSYPTGTVSRSVYVDVKVALF